MKDERDNMQKQKVRFSLCQTQSAQKKGRRRDNLKKGRKGTVIDGAGVARREKAGSGSGGGRGAVKTRHEREP